MHEIEINVFTIQFAEGFIESLANGVVGRISAERIHHQM
jgi:hypothetical protein